MLVHLVFVALVLSFAVAWYTYSGILSNDALVEQTLHRQQVVARSGAIMLQDFIRTLQRSESNFINETTNLDDVDHMETRLLHYLAEFANTPVAAAGILNTEGVEIVSVDRGGGIFRGTDYSDRKHVAWAKAAKPGEFYLSSPTVSKHGAEMGKYIGIISTPIFIQDEYVGVFSMTFSITKLTKTYLDPLKLTESSRVYLLSNDGVVVYSPIEKLIGANYFDVMATQNFEGKEGMVTNMHNALSASGEGKFTGFLINEETRLLTNYLIAYSPIYFNDQKIWTLGISSPENVALDFVGPLFDNQNRLLTFLVVIVIGFSLIGITGRRIGRNETYVKGFEDGRKSKDN